MSEQETGHYQEKVAAEIQHYANNVLAFFPPEAHRFWMQNYMWNKVEHVFGTRRLDEFYGTSLIHRKHHIQVLSVGSGDGQLELALARYLEASGCEAFTIHTTEISPIRQKRTITLIEQAGLGHRFEHHIVDLNESMVEGSFDLIFAHHVLHHIVNLEGLFGRIHSALQEDGVFATVDMIGRNGHMRWPEALEIIEQVWEFIPAQWKYNFQHQQYHEKYKDHDCSNVGFEGVRSQDILPSLLNTFAFEGFVAGGGFHDILLERGYGQSIDMKNKAERALICFLSDYNELLLETGRVKPTMIFAKMRKNHLRDSIKTVFYRQMTPEFALRKT
jgi:SAM-dependent methyltransferase